MMRAGMPAAASPHFFYCFHGHPGINGAVLEYSRIFEYDFNIEFVYLR